MVLQWPGAICRSQHPGQTDQPAASAFHPSEPPLRRELMTLHEALLADIVDCDILYLDGRRSHPRSEPPAFLLVT
jgi:hypothetical protein